MKSKKFSVRISRIVLSLLVVIMCLSMVVSVVPTTSQPVKAATAELVNAAASANGGSYTVVGDQSYYNEKTADDGQKLNDGVTDKAYSLNTNHLCVDTGGTGYDQGKKAFSVVFKLDDKFSNFTQIKFKGVRIFVYNQSSNSNSQYAQRDFWWQQTKIEISDNGVDFTELTWDNSSTAQNPPESVNDSTSNCVWSGISGYVDANGDVKYTNVNTNGVKELNYYGDYLYRFDAFDAKYVRITANSYERYLQFSEIEIYGEYTEDYYQNEQYLDKEINDAGGLNPQYTVSDGNGGYKNMTSFDEMENGEKMFVVLVNAKYNMFLTSSLQTASTLVAGADPFKGVYYTKHAFDGSAIVENGPNSPSAESFVWLLQKDASGEFYSLKSYGENAGYYLTTHGQTVTGTDSAGNKLYQYVGLNSANSNRNPHTNTANVGSKWQIEQLSDTNGALVALKHAEAPDDQLYLNLNKASWIESCDLTNSYVQIAKKTTDELPTESQWYIYPILQGFNRNTLYGFSGYSSTCDTKDRDSSAVTYEFDTTIVSAATNKTMTHITDFSTTTAHTHYFRFTDDYDVANADANRTQNMRLTCDPTGSVGNGTWQISPINYNGYTSTPLALDAILFGSRDSSTLGFFDAYSGTNAVAAANQRFFIFYSMTESGGYHLSPACYDTYASDTNRQYSEVGFRMYTLYDPELDEMHTSDREQRYENSLLLKDLDKIPEGESLFYLKGYEDATSVNEDLQLTVKDVLVREVLDSEGNFVSYEPRTDAEGNELVIGEFVFDNDASTTGNASVKYVGGTGTMSTLGSYERLIWGATLGGKVADAYTSAIPTGYLYVGYTSVNIVEDNEENVCYRYFAPYKYNFTFDGNTFSAGIIEGITLNYADEGAIPENTYEKEYTITQVLNNGEGTVVDTVVYDFLSWNTAQDGTGESFENSEFFTGEKLYSNFQEDRYSLSTNITLYAQWEDSKDYTFETPTRDGHFFYGWSNLEDGITENDMVTGITGVSADATVYAYWIGVDISGISTSRDFLTVNHGVYNEDTLQSSIVIPADKVSYEWYIVSGKDSALKIEDNTGNTTYTIGDDLSGCTIRVDFIYEGMLVESAYSAYIYSDVLVDATPADGIGKDYVVNATIGAGETVIVDITADAGQIISGIVGADTLNGVQYNLYGVWDGEKVLIMTTGETLMKQDVGVATEGLLFDSYKVELINTTDAEVTLNGFAISYLPRVYKLIVKGGEYDVSYLEGVENYVDGERAVDGENNIYYYNDDAISLQIKIGAGYKLAAGSYITLNGVKVHPTYSVANSDGYVIFSSVNAYEYYIGRTDSMDDIIFDKEDIEAVVFFEIADNGETTKRELNFGPLGVKLYDKGTERKIRFGTVWYLDDYASDNSWTREKKFGTYILPLRNILKNKNDSNDFYAWIQTNGTDAQKTLAETWYSDFGSVTDSQKAMMLNLLAKFYEDWNATAEDNFASWKETAGDATDYTMSFGGAEGKVPADYYYLVEDKNGNYFIEYSAVLVNIPDGMVNTELVYIPYTSFVYDWHSGGFVAESSHPNNVFIYKAPEKIYTYNNPEGSYPAVGELIIEDITLTNGNTATINPTFTEDTFEITYTENSSAITIDENGVISTNAPTGAVVTVTATTLHHEVTFTVTVVGDLEIDDVEIVDDYDAVEIPLNFLDGTQYDVTYSEVEGLTFVDDTVSATIPGEYTVTATTDYHTVTFKVTVLENPGTVAIADADAYNYNHTGTLYYDTGDFTVATDFYPEIDNANFNDVFEYEYDSTKLTIDPEKQLIRPTTTAEEGTYPVTVKYKGKELTTFNVTVITEDTSYLYSTIDGYDGKWFGDGSECRDPWSFLRHSTEMTNRGTTWNEGANDGKTTLFIGDSIFDEVYWSTFSEHYPDDDAMILGRASATTHDWERTAINGWISDSNTKAPKNIVLNIGTNNLGDTWQSPEAVELALKRMLLVLHERFPEANIYWFKILPRNDLSSTVPNFDTYRKTVSANMEVWASQRPWFTVLTTTLGYDLTGAEFLQYTQQQDGVHPAPSNYYIFTQTVAKNVDILLKDVSFSNDKVIDSTYGSTGVNWIKHTNWNVGEIDKATNSGYIVEGKLKITGTKTDGHTAPHLQIGFDEYAAANERILIWDAENDGVYNICFQDQYGSSTLTYKTGDVLEWKVVVYGTQYFLFIKDAEGEYQLALAKVGNSSISTPRLSLGSQYCDSEFFDMRVVLQVYRKTEYAAEISDPVIQDAIAKYTTEGEYQINS